jgi:hypothetical protein
MQKLLLRVASPSSSSLPPSLLGFFFFPFHKSSNQLGFSSPSSFKTNAKAEEVGAPDENLHEGGNTATRGEGN